MNYAELLRHPEWQRKRLKILERDNWKCVKCTDEWHNLQIHHLYYKRDALPWEYPDEALVTYCDLCHKKAEFIKWITKAGIKLLHAEGMSGFDIENILKLVIRRLNSNFHRESAFKYMSDIEKMMSW